MPKPSNRERADRGALMVRLYVAVGNDYEEPEEVEFIASDLISDVLHYCVAQGIDWEKRLRVAESNLVEELMEEEMGKLEAVKNELSSQVPK